MQPVPFMPKLIIQVPAYNEEDSLRQALESLPRNLEGFDRIEWLLVDDGSRDRSVAVARAAGVDHVVSLPNNQGLARAFMAGLEASLKLGADVIVNTDADNQYDASCIHDLVQPIVRGDALIVVGERPIGQIAQFSPLKRFLQRLGSAVVKIASATSVPDAPSGFRAIHREAALRLYVFNDYTYTLESIIQAGRKGLAIASVPVRVNPVTRPSRLIRSTPAYVGRSILTILRIFVLYKPFRFFVLLGTIVLLPGIVLGARFLIAFAKGQGDGHVQSLILASILIVTAVIIYVAGIITDLVSANRVLLEDIRMRLLRAEIDPGHRRQPS
ncbi:MAG: glycosyltransferase family 2 protein [Tepidisphaeraceae bacterium]